MDTNNQSMMVEGANPDMLWAQYMDYLSTQSRIMKKEYIRRKRANKPFTWNDLDVMNEKIHHDLDVVMSGVENVQENIQNKNMNKKLIRLTESDLHKIVKESVNRVLTELDWKTYASAAKKRGIQGDPKGTMHDLSNAATRALRDSHPTDGYKYNDEYPSIETFNDDYHGHAQKGMVPGLGSYNPYDGIPTDTYVDEFDKDRESWKRLNRRPDALQRDMDGYFSGKSKYVKGKGWQ